MVITDSGVPKEYAEAVLKKAKEGFLFRFSEGEKSKNFDTYKEILSSLTGLKVPKPTCKRTSSISTPFALIWAIKSVVKCNPAVGAALEPSIFE